MNRHLSAVGLKHGNKKSVTGGYTLVEVLIVLAVSTVMFVMITVAFSGRQGRTEFTQAIRNFEAKIQTMTSDVANGYFPSGFRCIAPGGTGDPSVTAVAASPGTNDQCMFLGKLMVGHQTDSDILTVVGRRTVGTAVKTDVVDLSQARPKAVDLPQVTDNYKHGYGLEIRGIYQIDASGNNGAEFGVFGFLAQLAGGVSSNPVSGSRSVVLYGLNTTVSPVTEDLATTLAKVNSTNLFIPPYGIRICLLGGNGQRAEVTIGAGSSRTALSSLLDTGTTGRCGSV